VLVEQSLPSDGSDNAVYFQGLVGLEGFDSCVGLRAEDAIDGADVVAENLELTLNQFDSVLCGLTVQGTEAPVPAEWSAAGRTRCAPRLVTPKSKCRV
jgi:hypothetical protein